MANPIADADDTQLEVWAFGRQGRVTDRELAEAALRELIRRGEERAEAERAEAELAAAAELARASLAPERATPDHDGDSATDPDESPDDDAASAVVAERHDRRMRTTGLAGLAAAALALLAVAPLLTPSPTAGDPLAVFERPATEADDAWVTTLTRDSVSGITLGPRAVDLGDGLTAVAFRAAATVDGRSTAYDPYCLWVSERGSSTAPGSLSGTCTLPERFAVEGVSVPLRPSAGGTGLDIVSWGPTGSPILAENQPLPSYGGVRSVLDWLVFPSVGDSTDPLAIVGDPERLLMGPSIVGLNAAQGVAGLDLTTWAYLREGQSADAPVLCVVSLVTDPTVDATVPLETGTCAPLEAVQRQGLRYTLTSAGVEWEVLIGPDGEGRTDRVQPASELQQ